VSLVIRGVCVAKLWLLKEDFSKKLLKEVFLRKLLKEAT